MRNKICAFTAMSTALLVVALTVPAQATITAATPEPATCPGEGNHRSTADEYLVCLRFEPLSPTRAAQQIGLAAGGQRKAPTGDASIQSWEPDPEPGTFPDFCDTEMTRTASCGSGGIAAQVIDQATKTVLGTAEIIILLWAELSNKSLTWKLETKAVVTKTTGVVTSGSTISAKPVCAAGCQADQSTADLPLVVDEVMRGSWQVTSNSPTPAGVINTQHLHFTLKLTGAANTAEVDTPDLPDVRCDNETRLGNISPGCVYPDVTPDFQLNGTAPPLSPVHAAFVASAQQRLPGHPGAVAGTPLHRLIDAAKRDANRARACAGFSLVGPDDSCDEYPFASTIEGGTGGVVDHVPRTDNSSGGTKLQTFYLANRILDGDAFFVTVVG